MKNIWKKVVLIFGLCMLFSFTTYGQERSVRPSTQEGQLPRLVDDAGLLSQERADSVLSQLDEISERQEFDVVIVTVDSLQGKYVEAFADDFYDYNGYGQGNNRDGILLLLAMTEREWAISTSGFGKSAFTDAGQKYIIDQIQPELREGHYEEAFVTFAKWSDDFVTQAKKGKPYEKGHLPVTASNIIFCVVVGLFAGFLLALLRVLMMKWQMRTVYHQAAASNYLVDGSCRMRDNSERLVRKTVNRIPIPRENHSNGSGGGSSIHTSSSGRTHGGSHGKF